jgi:hypothetical protein
MVASPCLIVKRLRHSTHIEGRARRKQSPQGAAYHTCASQLATVGPRRCKIRWPSILCAHPSNLAEHSTARNPVSLSQKHTHTRSLSHTHTHTRTQSHRNSMLVVPTHTQGHTYKLTRVHSTSFFLLAAEHALVDLFRLSSLNTCACARTTTRRCWG